MAFAEIVEIIRDFSSGEKFEIESSNGQIYVTHPDFARLVRRYIESEEGKKAPQVASELENILGLNERLRTTLMDDPEPIEDELLGKCFRFLKILGD